MGWRTAGAVCRASSEIQKSSELQTAVWLLSTYLEYCCGRVH